MHNVAHKTKILIIGAYFYKYFHKYKFMCVMLGSNVD